jgi:hypothetical protein
MDEIHTGNSNSSYEACREKSGDYSTLGSFKSSINSFLHSTLTKRTLMKTKSITELKSEDHSTELYDDDVDEDCDRKSVANFQKNYLELGQWPEVPVQVFQTFKNKYRGMKQKLKECKLQKEKTEKELKMFQNGEVPCRNCNDLKEKNSKTKAALEQAVSLSNLLLKELRKYESSNSSISE